MTINDALETPRHFHMDYSTYIRKQGYALTLACSGWIVHILKGGREIARLEGVVHATHSKIYKERTKVTY